MPDATADSTPATVPFLRAKLCSVLLAPFVPALVWGLLNPSFGDGQLSPGAGIALFLIFLLIPLTASFLFILLCTVLNLYAWLSAAHPVHRNEARVTILDWAAILLFLAAVGWQAVVVGTLDGFFWLVYPYGIVLLMSGVHYLYAAYHALSRESELKYTGLFLKAGFALLYGWTCYLAIDATWGHLFDPYKSYTAVDWVIVSIVVGMTAVLFVFRYRLGSRDT